MSVLTKLLEEKPGVRSTSRLAAIIMVVFTGAVVATACFVVIHAVTHAAAHGDQAGNLVSSVGSILSNLTVFSAPLVAGMLGALGLRKKTEDHMSSSTTTVTTTGPAAAPTAVQVTPTPPMETQ